MAGPDKPRFACKPRHWGFLLAASYFLVVGTAYIVFGLSRYSIGPNIAVWRQIHRHVVVLRLS